MRTDSAVPVKVKQLQNIRSISSGHGYYTDHSFAIDAHGEVWSWGLNHQGQTGLNDDAEFIKSPRKLFFARLLDGNERFQASRSGPAGPFKELAVGGNGVMIALHEEHLLRSADNGKTWSKQPLPASLQSPGIRYLEANETFYYGGVHSGYAGKLYGSKDGKSWTAVTLESKDGTALNMQDIQRINGTYVMTAANADRRVYDDQTLILTSKDGSSWKHVGTIPRSGASLIWNGKRYTAIAGGYVYEGKPATRNQFRIHQGSNMSAELIVFTSSDLTKWTMQSGSVKNLRYEGIPSAGMPYRPYWPSLHEVKANGTIVLSGNEGTMLESADGVTFKPVRREPLFHNVTRSEILWNGSRYLIYTQDGYSRTTVLLTSKDKVHWTKTAVSGLNREYTVAKRGSRFVAYNEYGLIAQSKDGISWSVLAKEQPLYALSHVFQANGLYIAAGTQTAESGWLGAQIPAILTSKDGKNWTKRFASKVSELADEPIRSAASNGKGYVAVTGRHAFTSPDGIKWTVRKLGAGIDLQKVVWTGKTYAAYGNYADTRAGTISTKLYTSADGIKWKEVYKSSGWLLDITAHNGTTVAVGYSGEQAIILSSSNATAWKKTSRTVGRDLPGWSVNNLNRYAFAHVQWVKDRFVIMSDYIYTSKDGVNWTTVESDYRQYVEDTPMLYANGQLAWTGKEYRYLAGSTIGVSSDLKTWAFYELDLNSNVAQMLWTGSDMLVVTDRGLLRITDK